MQTDPEGYLRSNDVDTGPDADTPRSCGIALILVMMERGGGSVTQVVLELTQKLLVSPWGAIIWGCTSCPHRGRGSTQMVLELTQQANCHCPS